MLHIEDAVAAGVEHHIHHLLHTGHPNGIDIAVGIHVDIPGDRNTDHLEAPLGNSVDDLWGRDGLSPGSFPVCGGRRRAPLSPTLLPPAVAGSTCRVGIEGIAEVIAEGEVLERRPSRGEGIAGIRSRATLRDGQCLLVAAALDGQLCRTGIAVVLHDADAQIGPAVTVAIARVIGDFHPRGITHFSRPVAIAVDSQDHTGGTHTDRHLIAQCHAVLQQRQIGGGIGAAGVCGIIAQIVAAGWQCRTDRAAYQTHQEKSLNIFYAHNSDCYCYCLGT